MRKSWTRNCVIVSVGRGRSIGPSRFLQYCFRPTARIWIAGTIVRSSVIFCFFFQIRVRGGFRVRVRVGDSFRVRVMDVGDATSTTSMDMVKVGLEIKVGLELGVILC